MTEQGSDPPVHRASRGRAALHIAISAIAWALFLWAWYVVFYKRTNEQTVRGVLALGVFLVLMLTVTLAWIRHNLRLAKRHAPRTAVPTVREDWRRDALGRELIADWGAIRRAAVVRVDVSENRKSLATETVPEP